MKRNSMIVVLFSLSSTILHFASCSSSNHLDCFFFLLYLFLHHLDWFQLQSTRSDQQTKNRRGWKEKRRKMTNSSRCLSGIDDCRATNGLCHSLLVFHSFAFFLSLACLSFFFSPFFLLSFVFPWLIDGCLIDLWWFSSWTWSSFDFSFFFLLLFCLLIVLWWFSIKFRWFDWWIEVIWSLVDLYFFLFYSLLFCCLIVCLVDISHCFNRFCWLFGCLSFPFEFHSFYQSLCILLIIKRWLMSDEWMKESDEWVDW